MKNNKKSPDPSSRNGNNLQIRNLPLDKCFISTNWEEQGLITLVVTRKHINGHFSCGLFLVDMFCLGLKETIFLFNEYERYFDFIRILTEEEGIKECTYTLAHNIIYGAIAYAEDLGFKPAENFNTSQYILEEDDDGVELMNIEFGLSGKPAISLENEKHPKKIIAMLEKNVGPEGFTIIK